MLRLITVLILLTGAGFAQDTTKLETDLSCENCHVSQDWQAEVGSKFDHITTGFELKGTHADISCGACHPGSNLAEKHDFSRADSECNTCHEDVHRDQWGQDCSQCHGTEGWALGTQEQNHDITRFPLTGPHRSVACEQCHVSNPGGGGPNLPISCAGCHQSSYGATTEPSHPVLELSQDCETCHSAQANSWSPSQFDHAVTGYNLIGMHGQATCGACHTQAASNTPSDCAGCHLPDYQASADPPHTEQGFPTDCLSCHTSFNWASQWNHNQTGFVLNGAHGSTDCQLCHVNGQFAVTPQTCAGCHQPNWANTSLPPHGDAGFDQNCQTCHTEVNWLPANWDHDTDTDYPLTGAHISADCLQCHLTAPYSEQSSDCYDCHRADYETSQDPDHVEAEIPLTCDVCHTTSNWDSDEIDHDLTEFPLEGAHMETDCETCHDAGYDLPVICEGCHLPAYESTASGIGPNHILYEFDRDCLICHDQSVWSPSFYDHDPISTGFEIKGLHSDLLPNDCLACHVDAQWTDIGVECESCHISNFTETDDPDHETQGFPANLCETCHTEAGWTPSIFSHEATAEACEGCHLTQYSNASNPPHDILEFPTTCQDCHSVTAWSPSSFIHDEITTGFLLVGSHEDVVCNDCHSTWEPATEIRTCAASSCHLDQYTATADPPHLDLSFPVACVDCHSEEAWTPSTFVHDDNTTGFVLAGSHVEVSCASCHTTIEPASEIRTCAASSCHLEQFNATTNPPHAILDFPVTCLDCHTETAWSPSAFVHDLNTTGFPLAGAHESVSCNDCHSSWEPASEVRTCAASSCHLDQFNATTNPPHQDLGFPVTCADCHTETAWSPSSFPHDESVTGFLLDGAHVAVACNSCHEDYQPPVEVRTCSASSCHLDQYQATTNPPHETMEIPQDCADCHATAAWLPADFTHNDANTGFPLEGAHTTVPCQQCHSPWENNPAVRTCAHSSCHLSDYQATTNPDHETASFPLDCEGCHTLTAWEPATFDHDGQFFPIYTGQHRNEWNDCSQCHINNNDYGVFTCFGGGCHSITGMNNEHCEGGGNCESCNGFTYPSNGVAPQDCLTCHPNGDEDDCGGDDLRDLPFTPRFMPQTNDKDQTN